MFYFKFYFYLSLKVKMSLESNSRVLESKKAKRTITLHEIITQLGINSVGDQNKLRFLELMTVLRYSYGTMYSYDDLVSQ